MNFCKDCKWHKPSGHTCGHESARDLVSGRPGDAAMQRYDDPPEGAETCGREGKFWEAK